MPCCCFQFCEGKKEKEKKGPQIFADRVFLQTWLEFPCFACILFLRTLRNFRFAKGKKNPPECL
jgi:hypothetical protein